jgi:CheY-like chemotaxis protein
MDCAGVRTDGMVRVDFKPLSFLVVDDSAHMRRLVRTLLHGFGAREIYEAENGAAGLEVFTRNLPNIVILDCAMPIFDGIELTRMIRQSEDNPDRFVPIIMLTGNAERRRVLDARDAGVTDFLVKPISAKVLYERIVNIVANPRPPVMARTCTGPDRRHGSN